MSNTIIQIRRSTTNASPLALQPGELAFTSNGDTLWIGSPSGSNTANVIHVGAKISYIGNSTQIGASAGGSNSELASTYAIKEFVDGKLNAFSTTLDGLDDVTITSVANNNLLVYDLGAGKWENHTIGGTANQINVAFVSQDITISLPNTVTVNTLTTTGNVVISGTQNVSGEAHFFEVVHVNRDYPAHVAHYITNPTIIATVNTNSYGQLAMQNFNGGVNASADFIAYPNNTQVDDNTGFIDMGIAGNGYNEAAYAVTGPNDGYIFVSARSGDSLGGSLILATDSTGTNNDIKFFVGGFTYNANAPHMVLTGNNRNFGIGNSNPLHKISVEGSARFNGNTDVIGSANVSVAINVGANVSLSTSYISVGNSTVNTYITAGNLALNGSTLTIGNTSTNTTITSGNITTTGTANVATAINVGANVNLTTSSFTVGNSSVNSYITSTSAAFDGTLAAGNTTITGTLAAGNTTITGDLTVTGTVTTVDATNLVVEDSLIRLARNQANTASFVDAVDVGFYGVYGNTSQVVYTGLARDSSANVFVLFDGLVNDAPDNVVNTSAITVTTLQAYLLSGALSTNSTAVAITANSTVNVSIVANTLTLSTSLGVASGGTGRNSLTNNAVVVGNNAGPVTLVSSSTEGHVLQIDASGIPTFGVLDGGSF